MRPSVRHYRRVRKILGLMMPCDVSANLGLPATMRALHLADMWHNKGTLPHVAAARARLPQPVCHVSEWCSPSCPGLECAHSNLRPGDIVSWEGDLSDEVEKVMQRDAGKRWTEVLQQCVKAFRGARQRMVMNRRMPNNRSILQGPFVGEDHNTNSREQKKPIIFRVSSQYLVRDLRSLAISMWAEVPCEIACCPEIKRESHMLRVSCFIDDIGRMKSLEEGIGQRNLRGFLHWLGSVRKTRPYSKTWSCFWETNYRKSRHEAIRLLGAISEEILSDACVKDHWKCSVKSDHSKLLMCFSRSQNLLTTTESLKKSESHQCLLETHCVPQDFALDEFEHSLKGHVDSQSVRVTHRGSIVDPRARCFSLIEVTGISIEDLRAYSESLFIWGLEESNSSLSPKASKKIQREASAFPQDVWQRHHFFVHVRKTKALSLASEPRANPPLPRVPYISYQVRLAAVQLEELERNIVDKACESINRHGFLNYFAPSRFSNCAKRGFFPGIALLKGDYREAADLILATPVQEDSIVVRHIRRALWQYRQDHRSIHHNTSSPFESSWSNLECEDAFAELGEAACMALVREALAFMWNFCVSLRIRKLGPRAVVYGDMVQSVKNGVRTIEYASASSIAAGKHTPFDVVMPLPGRGSFMPKNDVILGIIAEASALIGLPFHPEAQCWPLLEQRDDYTKSLHVAPSVRTIIQRPEPHSVAIVDVTEAETGAAADVVLKFSLPTSAYPSMLLRELCKSDTCNSETLDITDSTKKSSEDSLMKKLAIKKCHREFLPSRALQVAGVHRQLFRSSQCQAVDLLPPVRSGTSIAW